MQGLRAAQNRGEGLQRCADYVVVGLLRGERASGGLGVKAQRPGTRVFCAVTFDHRFVPYAASSAVLGDFFKEIAVRVEKERKLRPQFVEIHSAAQGVFDV